MPERPTSRAPRRSAAETRELILDVARELFYWQGIHAVGVDTIAAEAGVAPTTLYRHFGSKDELVGAYVQREAAGHREWFERSLGAADAPAGERLVSLFEAVGGLVAPEICRGCPFQMTLAETPDPDQPGHRAAVELKIWVCRAFGTLAREHMGLGATSSKSACEQAQLLADQLMLIFEGAFATAASLGADGPPSNLGAIARALLRQ